jgi:hypothetical protein
MFSCDLLALLWRERIEVRVARIAGALTLALSHCAGEGIPKGIG